MDFRNRKSPSEAINSILKTISEVGSIAENDLDADELCTLRHNLDYFSRYINQMCQARQAENRNNLGQAELHMQHAKENLKFLSESAKW